MNKIEKLKKGIGELSLEDLFTLATLIERELIRRKEEK